MCEESAAMEGISKKLWWEEDVAPVGSPVNNTNERLRECLTQPEMGRRGVQTGTLTVWGDGNSSMIVEVQLHQSGTEAWRFLVSSDSLKFAQTNPCNMNPLQENPPQTL